MEKKVLFCTFPCAFNSLLFRSKMIFYLNVFKAIKFALKVIDMNRPAPNLQLDLGTELWRRKLYPTILSFFSGTNSAKKSNKRFKYSSFAIFCFNFLQFRLMANCRYNFLRHISFPSPNCKVGAGLFISITLRANLIALKCIWREIVYPLVGKIF